LNIIPYLKNNKHLTDCVIPSIRTRHDVWVLAFYCTCAETVFKLRIKTRHILKRRDSDYLL